MRSRVLAIVVAVVVPLLGLGVFIATRDGSHGPARLPILAGGSAGGETLAARADIALYPYPGIVYRAGANVPALTGDAPAYKIVNRGDPERLATALSMPAEPDVDGNYTNGDAQLTVAPNGFWGYTHESFGGGAVSSGTATACPENADCATTDTTRSSLPERPADLPSQDDATRIALDLLSRAGIDTSHVNVAVDDGITQWIVRIDPIVDGIPTEGFATTVTVGTGGVVQYANGNLGTPQRGDTYPLLGTAKAIERLNEGKGFVGPRALAADTPAAAAADTAVGAPAAAAGSSPGSAGAGSGGSTGSAPSQVDPVPPERPVPEPVLPPEETVPPPAPQQVTLVNAEQVLLLATSYDGNDAYLVPAYRFTSEQGTGPTVLAIDDSFLTPPDLLDGTTPIDSGGIIEPQPAPAPEPADKPELTPQTAPASAADGGR